MRRREFLAMAAGAGFPAGRAQGAPQAPRGATEEANAYFRNSGAVSPAEQEEIESYIENQQELSRGVPVRLRGRPVNAPTYRFVHWPHNLGDPQGQFVFPLSVRPTLAPAKRYQVNAQLLNFHPSTQEWQGREEKGTLTIELQGQTRAKPQAKPETTTSLFVRPFDIYFGKDTTLGFEFIGQRDGFRYDLLSDSATVGVRIQLMRIPQSQGGFLKKVLEISASVATGAATGPVGAALSLLPAIRVPEMTREAVSFAQGVFGSVADSKQEPIWRSGFNAYGLVEGESRVSLQPGYWLVVDEKPEDLRGARLEDRQGVPTLVQDGNPVDVNYVVLDLMIRSVPES